jgi:hypothetical protein
MKTLLIAAALAGLTWSANAAEPAPLGKNLLGTWCSDGKEGKLWRYQREINPPKGRAPCKGNEWMEMKQNGYEGPEFSCKLVDSIVAHVPPSNPPQPSDIIEIYHPSYRCTGEGYAWKEELIIIYKGTSILVDVRKKK